MTAERSALLGLTAVSLLWGCNYVISSYLLHGFSPIMLSFARISITSLFLILVGLFNGGLRRPTMQEWALLAGAGIFGTLFNQTFYFTGLHHSTAANASLIIALVPVATAILERIFLKESFTRGKIAGALLGITGVIVIVIGGKGGFGITTGDLYLLIAMLTQSISLLYIRKLSSSMSSYAITIFSTVIGSLLMLPAASGEGILGHTVVSHHVWLWGLMAIAGIICQGVAGFWWNKGVAVVGAGTAAMFMNIPPFVAILVGHWVLGDPIYATQLIGGVLVLLGVLTANRKTSKLGIKINQLSSKTG
ncbi:MAG: hypothetical protein JWN30_2606 [Bacilli bacterium]|nr:hypothetical protein [Bacilli bacterium]